MNFPQLTLSLIGLVCTTGLLGFGLVSIRESELRPARRAFGLALLLGALTILAVLAQPILQTWLLVVLFVVVVGLAILFVLPIGKVELGVEPDPQRFDERDILFARARLRPGSPEYDAYYAMRPENKEPDDLTRKKPGLLSPQARFADRLLFAAPQGSFGLTEALREAVDGPLAEPPARPLSPPQLTSYIKSLAQYFGALQVGVAELKPYHVYSHVGRGSGVYGEPIVLEHRYALVFTVEMNAEMVSAAPIPPITMESARQYVEAARVAVQLAGALRALGYPARAHIDGNYRVIAPLVARDAGLGEIGRMGLLMTPKLGPRVRLGAVTTSAELVVDGRRPDPAVIDFCNICSKCAANCPSQSIPYGERQMQDGALRWKIDSESCFRYWNVIGTDCGRCIAVCPYSHPDSFYHNLLRWGIARSGAFRRLANWMDDWFYGKKPTRQPGPVWTRLGGSIDHQELQ